MIDASISRQQLSLWLVAIGMLGTQFFFLLVTPLSFGVTCTCAMLFLVVYARCAEKLKLPMKLAFAFLASGIAYSIAIGFFVLMSFAPPARPTPPILPPAPFLLLIDFFFFGGFLTEFVRAIVLIFSYVLTIIIIALTASLISLAFLRHHRFAKWILMVNTPWLLLTAWLVFAMIYESLD